MSWFNKKPKEPEWVPVTADDVTKAAKAYLLESADEYWSLVAELQYKLPVTSSVIAESDDLEETLEVERKQRRLNTLRARREDMGRYLLHPSFYARRFNDVRERP